MARADPPTQFAEHIVRYSRMRVEGTLPGPQGYGWGDRVEQALRKMGIKRRRCKWCGRRKGELNRLGAAMQRALRGE